MSRHERSMSKHHLGLVIALGVALSISLAGCAPAVAPSPPAISTAPSTTTVPSARPTVAAPPPTPAGSQPRYGDTLTIAAITDPASFDPQQDASINNSLLVAPAYNNLLYYDQETGSKVVPELAERWDLSPDGLTYTFKLRQGVAFHDGTRLNAGDVAFNLERMKSPPKGVRSTVDYLMTGVDNIEAVGDDTVRIKMKYPFAALTSALVTDYMVMYSKKAVETQGNMKTTIMGTGPFKFKSYTPSVSLELVKNDKYWAKGRPYLDGITFFIIKDNATRLAALRTGQAKLSARLFGALTPTDVSVLKKDVPDMRFIPTPSVVGPAFFMNMRNPPFKDPRVRQAISLAVDRQAAVKVIAQGEGQVGTFFPFEGWGIPTNELLRMPGYRQPKDQDIAAAKKLLADAGYANGFTVNVLSRGNEITRNGAVFITGQLSKLGIQANVQVLEDALFWDRGRNAQYETMVYTPAPLVADPYDMGKNYAPRGYFNFVGDDEDVTLNQLWDKQVRSVDVQARKATIIELDRYLMTTLVPAVPLAWPTSFIAVAPQVRGFVPGINDYSNNRHQETWLASR